MDELKIMLMKIQMDIDEQKKEIKQLSENINQKFQKLEDDYTKSQAQIEIQEKRLDALEKEARKRNIVFFGIQEKEKNYAALEKNILEIINETMNVTCERNEIESLSRKGKWSEGKVRPVVVTLATLGKKIDIMKNKNNLQKTDYYIKQDYPLKVIEKRKLLQKELEQEKQKGNKAIIKYDKLIILSPSRKNNTQENTSMNRKRNHSRSPPNQDKNKNFGAVSATKKNKVSLHEFLKTKQNDIK